MTDTNIVTVDFHGHPLITLKLGDEIRVAMKPICEAIGLDWEGQRQRIQRHPVLSQGAFVIKVPYDNGFQDSLTLPLDLLNGWLFGVSTNRVNPEIRDKLIEYQRECFHVLHDYWTKGEAINPRVQYVQNPGDILSKAQCDILRNLLTDAAEKLPKEKQAGLIITGWSKLKAHFKVGYRDIPQAEFAEAVSLVARHISTGEWAGLEKTAQAALKHILGTHWGFSYLGSTDTNDFRLVMQEVDKRA